MIVRLFGALRIENGDRVLRHHQLGGVKARQILEILAVRRGRAVGKVQLAERLWAERPPVSIDATIETHVSLLRRAIDEPAAVETVPHGYRLGSVELDLDRFDQLLAEGSLVSLVRAVALADAEVGDHDPGAVWFRDPRERYAAHLTEAFSRAGRLALGEGVPELALDLSRRAVERDALREDDHQTLIAAHSLLGDRSASLKAFERCRQVFRVQLGVDPGPVTNALHRSVLLGLPIQLGRGRRGEGPPRALIVESEGCRQGRLVAAAAAAGCTCELVPDLQAAFARLAGRHFDVAVIATTTTGAAELAAAAPCPVLRASPRSEPADLTAAIGAELGAAAVSGSTSRRLSYTGSGGRLAPGF